MQILQNVWTALTTENEVLVNFICIPFYFIEATISMLLFTTLLNIKCSVKRKMIYIFSLSILSVLSRLFIPDPHGTYFNILICFVLILCIFKVNILKAIICELYPILIETIISFVLLKVFILFFKIDYYQATYTPLYRAIFSLLEYTIMYIFYLFVKHFNIHIFYQLTKKEKILFILDFILGLISISSQMYIIMYYTDKLPIFIVLLTTSSLIAYFLLSIYGYINASKLNIARQNLEETRLMNKTLTILNDKIRAFRHDFNNIIQAIGGYIQAKDIDGLEKYYSQLLKDCQEVTNLSGLNPESINNPAIYSLLASKYYLATEKGIEFNLDIFMDLTSIDMKIYEFCRILGILLDNAIQATQECEEKQITVTIRKDNRCKRQLLIVENTYKEKDIDTEKIFEKGYSTKEGNTGLGLWEVRQILLKNTNLNLFTSKDNTYFKQQLEIYKS
jgi:two-component system sensor histidine kinase AgrC